MQLETHVNLRDGEPILTITAWYLHEKEQPGSARENDRTCACWLRSERNRSKQDVKILRLIGCFAARSSHHWSRRVWLPIHRTNISCVSCNSFDSEHETMIRNEARN